MDTFEGAIEVLIIIKRPHVRQLYVAFHSCYINV